MTKAFANRRDAPVIYAAVAARSHGETRQQRFCSDRCRNREIGHGRVRKASSGRDTGAPANPTKKNRNFSALRRAELLSSRRILAPADVLAIEVFGRAWNPAVSSGGVPIEVRRFAHPGREGRSLSAMAYVGNGGKCVGFVLRRGRSGYGVFDTDEKSLGLFATEAEWPLGW
jgi:hypothetical protein